MAGELSPDRHYYWDGQRWVSAFSADGAWQWDGQAWRAAQGSAGPRRSPRWAWIIAGVTIVAVALAGVGVYFAVGAAVKLSQRFAQSGLNATCNSALAQPGNALVEGDSLCGATLGSEFLLADCTLTDGPPAGMVAWQKTYGSNATDWQKTSVTAGPDGCHLVAAPDSILHFDAADLQPPQSVLIADFTLVGKSDTFGMELACTKEASCIDISIDSHGLYSLDQGRPNDGWENLTKGFVTFGSVPRLGANRMILRLSGKQVSVYLDGVAVTHATTTRAQSTGLANFYLDNRFDTTSETVRVQRFYVFESR